MLPPTGRAGGVVTIHDLAYLTMPDLVDATSRRLRELVPRSLKRAAAVCTPSQAIADEVRDTYGGAVPEVVVTPLGVEPEWLLIDRPDLPTRERLRLPDDYFLFVGTREPRKDLRTLLAAYQQFRAEWPVADGPVPTLLLVGPDGWGPGQEPADGVQIRDYAPVEELRTIIAGARALVMPSRDEGFGLPALEGLATGVPVIISSVPALVEVTGGHAAVFDIGDVEGLAGLLTAGCDGSDDGSAVASRPDVGGANSPPDGPGSVAPTEPCRPTGWPCADPGPEWSCGAQNPDRQPTCSRTRKCATVSAIPRRGCSRASSRESSPPASCPGPIGGRHRAGLGANVGESAQPTASAITVCSSRSLVSTPGADVEPLPVAGRRRRPGRAR